MVQSLYKIVLKFWKKSDLGFKWSARSTPSYIPKIIENIGTSKNMCIYIYLYI